MMLNEKVQSEFRRFIDSIYDKTGISLGIFSFDGYSVFNEDEVIDVQKLSDSEEVVFDSERNKYIFKLNISDTPFYGVISSESSEGKPNAVLIKELAENQLFKNGEMTVEDFYKSLALGELTFSEITKYQERFSLPQDPCGIMLFKVEDVKVNDVIGVMESYIEKDDCVIKFSDGMIAIVKFIKQKEEIEYSFYEFANFLVQFIFEEIGVKGKIFVGGIVNKIFDLSTSFNQALITERMSNTMFSKGDVHSYKEYLLFKILEDLPKNKLTEYYDSLIGLRADTVFDDKELVDTAEEFLENNLNVSESARKMFLHRNTLTYRLDKIKKSTGLDVRNFTDAVTFRLITLLRKLLK